TMSARIEDSLSRERMVASLAGAFGALALVLAAVGLYGLLAYSVARRTREIGIRMALGATAGAVLWMVAREALGLVALGCVAGLAIAVAALRALTHYLDGVSAIDPAMAAECVAALICIAAIAAVVPAMRGSRIHPVQALRE